MSRPRTGTFEFRGRQWWVRHTVTVDGISVRRWFPLGTDSMAVRNAKNQDLMKRLARGEIPESSETKAAETFACAAARILEQQERDGMRSISDRRQRVRDYAARTLSHLDVTKVRPGHIREALEACRDTGHSKGTIKHLRQDLDTIFDDLWRNEDIGENPVKKVKLPKGATEDLRPRQLLTDEEFSLFWHCQAVPYRLRLMALSSRAFGGMRTSDLHAWRWEHIDTAGWRTAQVKRPKVKGRALMILPAVMVVPLKAWWVDQGKRTSGPVFPVGRGDRATEHRGHIGYARALRTALRRAFGIDAPQAVRTKMHDRKEHWRPVREPTARELELLADNEQTKRLDFHSFRRAYSTALADAGVNLQTAMRLTGHTKPETHMGYVSRLRPLETPSAVLPTLRGKTSLRVFAAPTVPRFAMNSQAIG